MCKWMTDFVCCGWVWECRIWELIKHYYLGPRHLYEDVIAFNEKSEKFDFQKVLGVAQVST